MVLDSQTILSAVVELSTSEKDTLFNRLGAMTFGQYYDYLLATLTGMTYPFRNYIKKCVKGL